MFKNHLKIALRNLKRHKGYSFINISGLAVGIACSILILLWVEHELSYDRFHENADELYRVALTTERQDFHGSYLPGLLADFLKDDYPEITCSSILGITNPKLTYEEKSFFSPGYYVHPSFFDMFTFHFVNGDPKTSLSNPSSIVITEELANKFYGSDDPLGKTIIINDRIYLNVTGVIKNIPCLLYTSPSPRDATLSRMPSSA